MRAGINSGSMIAATLMTGAIRNRKTGETVYALTLGIPEQSVTFEALDDSIGIEQVSLVESDQPVQVGAIGGRLDH